MGQPLFDFDDRHMAPFEPASLMPAQYFTARQRHRARSSEARLMYAILEDAISVYCRHREPTRARDRRSFRAACRWIESSDRTWLFSYLRICEALDLDAEYIRRGLRARRVALAGTMPVVE